MLNNDTNHSLPHEQGPLSDESFSRTLRDYNFGSRLELPVKESWRQKLVGGMKRMVSPKAREEYDLQQKQRDLRKTRAEMVIEHSELAEKLDNYTTALTRDAKGADQLRRRAALICRDPKDPSKLKPKSRLTSEERVQLDSIAHDLKDLEDGQVSKQREIGWIRTRKQNLAKKLNLTDTHTSPAKVNQERNDARLLIVEEHVEDREAAKDYDEGISDEIAAFCGDTIRERSGGSAIDDLYATLESPEVEETDGAGDPYSESRRQYL